MVSGPLGCEVIGRMLRKDNSLAELTISGNGIGPVGVQHLVNGIMQNNKCKLKILDLSFNRITDQGAQIIAPMLRDNTRIVRLNLNGNELTDQGASVIFDALSGSTHETSSASIASAASAASGASAVLEDGEKRTYLKALQCGFNPGIGDAAMESLARMLLENHTLVSCEVDCNSRARCMLIIECFWEIIH